MDGYLSEGVPHARTHGKKSALKGRTAQEKKLIVVWKKFSTHEREIKTGIRSSALRRGERARKCDLGVKTIKGEGNLVGPLIEQSVSFQRETFFFTVTGGKTDKAGKVCQTSAKWSSWGL